MDPECSKLLNGKAKDLNPLGQKTAAVDMKIDSPDAEHPPRTMGYEVSKQVYEINMRDNNASPSRASEANHQSEEILQLKTKNKKLEYDLDKSEKASLRNTSETKRSFRERQPGQYLTETDEPEANPLPRGPAGRKSWPTVESNR